MEKILVFENTGAIQRTLNVINDNLEGINQIIEKFNELNLGVITEEDLTDIFSKDCKNIASRYSKYIEADIKKLKITNPSVIKNLKKGSMDTIDEFRDDVNNLIRKSGTWDPDIIPLIKIKKGKPVLTEENIEQLRERYRVYVTTEDGAVLRDMHIKAATAMNDFFALLVKNNPNFSNWDILKVVTTLYRQGDNELCTPQPLFYDDLMKNN